MSSFAFSAQNIAADDKRKFDRLLYDDKRLGF